MGLHGAIALATGGSGGSEQLVQGSRNRAALKQTTSVDNMAGQVVCLCKTSETTGVDGGIHFN